ncbi:MAG: hypothetical protein Q8M05_13180 [Rhodoferax sp.]|uniref:hypothetical protein n=1 Tax=Rhodoferax sp. TaxID=50421 RepID=UPI00272F4C7C|nr:hypothetical protein [Rhodoferax sp.]MDP1530328.1 hypothetical protein [Rhodoferax sp.]MDP1943326.1 hypothetical protein [Rhodoferax sp.]
MSYFEAALDLHKEKFEPFRALVVVDDKALRRYVMRWGPALVRRHDDYPLDNDMGTLWACVTVNFQALADLTGHSLPQVNSYFRQAQGLQLIYPDGTVPDAVVKLLRRKLNEIT